ncbi:conserved hypothetical protein [Thioalkalivibrio sulfidiphilus HL-EbGr7]|uniref:Phage protein n=1 Tax=Thioalkalivibrio sulfidiphilus (strain HL-EbGR7) TaxID=396588 RepID=B8GUX8_THISH|nr:hypothetical protein [Thioalkalivibrio sulfidiphilus]ACL71489.1 conserved hypothetical protein [Thioalkalivibrio sulfidiphilus HL-EbGr7]
MTGHFLALEPLIEARLKAHLPAGVHVLTAADLAGVEERAQVTPAVHLIYRGYRPTQDQGQGKIQEIEQIWWTVVAVRSARDIKGGSGTREQAGPIIDAVLEALMGWRPIEGYLPLKLAPSAAPAYRAGFAYHPLGWTTRTTKRGAQQ